MFIIYCIVASALLVVASASQAYMTTNFYLSPGCAGDAVKVTAYPVGVCVNYVMMQTTGEAKGDGYIYTYESYSDNKCTKLKSSATYVQSTLCALNQYGLYYQSFYSASQPTFPAKGVKFVTYEEFNNGNCTGNGVTSVYKPDVCIPGERNSYACPSTGNTF